LETAGSINVDPGKPGLSIQVCKTTDFTQSRRRYAFCFFNGHCNHVEKPLQEDDMRLISLEANKALWVGTDGYCRDCRVSFGDFDELQIDISVVRSNGRTLPIRLRSIDGFRFIGKSVINGRSLVATATLYRHDGEFLFFGTWHQDKESGEFVIHAHEVNSMVKSLLDPEFMPAA
jgi:hypothetical protein